MSQPARLLTYLESHGSVTRLEAFTMLGIANLWARVAELRRLGYRIDGQRVKVPTRYGDTNVVRYTLTRAA